MNLRSALRICIVLFLVFPFLFLLTQFHLHGVPDTAEMLWAFKNSLLQAAFSALGAMVLGSWSALGLLNFSVHHRPHWRFVLEILCLLPNFLPPIFILLATLNIIDPFPMGITGIALIHTIMNFGLVAVILSGIIESKLGGVIELSYVEGVSRWTFLRKALFPMLKEDLRLLGLFVFVMCFGSFAVPLIVGGSRGTTIEVLIYERIRLSSNWTDAVVLAFLQSTFIFCLSLVVNKGRGHSGNRLANLSLIKIRTGVAVIVAITLLYLGGYVQGLIAGLGMISTFYDVQSALFWNFLGSMAIGLSVGILAYLSLMLIAYCWPKQWFEKFLNGYVAPSTALACFCFLILGPNEGIYPFVKIPLALVLLYMNGLFRMGWQSELQGLQSQITVAYSMGASPHLIFKDILFPQLSARAGVLAGLASVWACGDFAASRILAHRDISLGMMTETLMSSYRLSQATLLSLGLVITGLICFILCVGGSRVLRRKFKS